MGDFGPIAPVPVDGGVNPSPSISEDVTVLVTGFGPFRKNPLNPSYLIASSLPSSIPFPGPSGAKASADNQSRKIRIHTHPSPLRVSYSAVRNAVPTILNSYAQTHDGRRPDIIVHIGLASSRSFYSVETLAHRDGYYMPDVDGRVGFEDGEKRWREHSCPETLRPGPAIDRKHNNIIDNDTILPVNPTTMETATATATTEARTGEASSFSTTISPSPTAAASTTSQPINPYPPDLTFIEHWKTLSPPSADIRLSTDAGRYLCEFILYTSLEQALREGQPRNVTFLHVPGSTDNENIEKGTEVTIALLKTLVSCWVDGG